MTDNSAMKDLLARQVVNRMKRNRTMEEAVESLLDDSDDEMVIALRELLHDHRVKTDKWTERIRVRIDPTGGAIAVDSDNNESSHRSWYLSSAGPRGPSFVRRCSARVWQKRSLRSTARAIRSCRNSPSRTRCSAVGAWS